MAELVYALVLETSPPKDEGSNPSKRTMKAERREKIRKNNRKMIVSGKGIFNLLRIRLERLTRKLR